MSTLVSLSRCTAQASAVRAMVASSWPWGDATAPEKCYVVVGSQTPGFESRWSRQMCQIVRADTVLWALYCLAPMWHEKLPS